LARIGLEVRPLETGFIVKSRLMALKNAFALAVAPVLTRRLRFLIVDDVFTTGSTLTSCAWSSGKSEVVSAT
jgi:predicted amidophosphoribosyltransferase